MDVPSPRLNCLQVEASVLLKQINPTCHVRQVQPNYPPPFFQASFLDWKAALSPPEGTSRHRLRVLGELTKQSEPPTSGMTWPQMCKSGAALWPSATHGFSVSPQNQ